MNKTEQSEWVISCHPAKGTFLDIGAHKPNYGNNTVQLEREGWTGWAFDKDGSLVSQWSDRSTPFIVADLLNADLGELFASIPDFVTYLSLDVDAATTDVLERLPERMSFGYITIEHDVYRGNDGWGRTRQREHLSNLGYVIAKADVEIEKGPYEDWWIKS